MYSNDTSHIGPYLAQYTWYSNDSSHVYPYLAQYIWYSNDSLHVGPYLAQDTWYSYDTSPVGPSLVNGHTLNFLTCIFELILTVKADCIFKQHNQILKF